jgi:nucleotide-binding universal stress UspA family protein
VFRNVLVGVDERPGGRDAIALGKDLLARDGELTLVYVHLGEAKPSRGASPAFEAAEQERARRLLEAARREAGIDAGLAWTGSPSVGRGLHELAERRGADLLVVGSPGHGLFGRVLIRDDTRDALNGAPCAVAVAPAGYSERTWHWREIGVGYDGSPESEHALAMARRFAAALGVKVSAFEAIPLPRYLFTGDPAPVDKSIEEFVDEARDRIAALGDVEPHAAYGAAAEELALYSASVELLIVGSRGYGPIGRLVHGSTSQRLAHRARCPLLVLPRAAQSSGDPLIGVDRQSAARAERGAQASAGAPGVGGGSPDAL